MTPTGCTVHSALQGRRRLTSPRQRLTGGPIGAQEGEAPRGAESILDRCTGEEKGEDERRLRCCMKMSPERRDLVLGETINSSLQWLCEGPRASRGPSGEEAVREDWRTALLFTVRPAYVSACASFLILHQIVCNPKQLSLKSRTLNYFAYFS